MLKWTDMKKIQFTISFIGMVVAAGYLNGSPDLQGCFFALVMMVLAAFPAWVLLSKDDEEGGDDGTHRTSLK